MKVTLETYCKYNTCIFYNSTWKDYGIPSMNNPRMVAVVRQFPWPYRNVRYVYIFSFVTVLTKDAEQYGNCSNDSISQWNFQPIGTPRARSMTLIDFWYKHMNELNLELQCSKHTVYYKVLLVNVRAKLGFVGNGVPTRINYALFGTSIRESKRSTDSVLT